uniref:Tetraspanin n=1 Tax=Anopheles epiroticus TaxID=199890 RepID=A0A182P780_9DIPT
MFVMLSVRTTTTVRERHAETVQKAININQLIRNISNRKHRKPRTTQTQQQQQQQQQQLGQTELQGLGQHQQHGTTTVSSISNISTSSTSSSDSSNSSDKHHKNNRRNSKDSAKNDYNNAKHNNCLRIDASEQKEIPGEQCHRSKNVNVDRNCNSIRDRTAEKRIDKTVPSLIGTIVSTAAVISDPNANLPSTRAPVALCTISQPNGYRLPVDLQLLSVELAKPPIEPANKIHTELVLTASLQPAIRTLTTEAVPTTTTRTATIATIATPTRNACSIAPPEPQQQQRNNATNLNVNQQTDANDKDKSKFLLPELNNFRKPPTVQVPVATILNDLSPVPAPVKVTNKITNSNPMSPMTPAGLQSNSPDVKAMRYYRLWIYTCNAVLLMAVIVFCGVAGKILLSDYKRLLVNGLSLTQPSFIYAYLALLVQSGFLQLIGCLGALRLSEKLLNAYWLLLLVLLIGDAMLGIFWMFKFDRVMHDLQPMLKYRLAHEYGNSPELTELWDRLQNEGRCCGVTGPQDFALNANRTYPTSCCTSDITEQISIGRRPLASAIVFRGGEDPTAAVAAATELAASTIKDTLLMSRNFSELSDSWSLITAPSSGSSAGGTNTDPLQQQHDGSAEQGAALGPGQAAVSSTSDSSSTFSSGSNHAGSSGSSSSSYSSTTGSSSGGSAGASSVSGGEMEEIKTIVTCRAVYQQGCAERIVSWLRHTADILFVLGYCVIAFLKLCFLGILRYEIKEMIQKIKLLQTEMSGAILNGVDCDQQQIQQQVTSTSVNGGIHAEPKVGNRDRERTRVGSAESERESLLTQENTPKQLLKHKQLYTCINEQQQQQQQQQQHICGQSSLAGSSGAPASASGGPAGGAGGGCESDTNSNCALLVEDNNGPSLLSAATGTTKTINGNNNYELCEFDAKVPTYRYKCTRSNKFVQHQPAKQAPLFGDRWRKSRPNATRPGQQPTASESFDETASPSVRPGGSAGSRMATTKHASTTTTTTTTTLGSTAATSGSSVSGPGPGGGGAPSSSTGGSSSSSASVKCTVVNRLHSITAGGSGTARSGDPEGMAPGSTGGASSSGSKKRQQRSRITYDREQGVRFYRGTETTDSNDCDCEDI